MTLSEPHALQPFWELAGSQVKQKALEIALTKSIFDLLFEPCSAEKVAQKLLFEVNNTEAWLELLWGMGCLNKNREEDHTIYSSSDLARRYLLSTSPQSCSHALLFRFQTLNNFADQFEAGLQPSTEDNKTPQPNMAPLWANAAKAQIFQEQRAVTVPALNLILDKALTWGLSIPNKMHFLDLGGGHGLISLALANRYPKSTGVLFDLPETTQVAQSNIIDAGIEHRISVQSGDLNESLPTGLFDVIWCSSVLHFLETPYELLKHIESILKPNGILLILHAEHTLDKALSEQVLPFYLPMVMKGKYLPKPNDILTCLQSNNMELIKSEDIICFPMAPVKLHCVRKLA